MRAIRVAAVLLLLGVSAPAARAADAPPGSMSIPVKIADLAAAAGIPRIDPSTLPIDIVRLAFASPEGLGEQSGAARRTAIVRALETAGDSGDRVPLPLSAGLWRARVLHADVPDDRLASAILGHRTTALLYHGLLGLDPSTLAWMEGHPAVLDTLLKNPGATAAFARSIHIRDGAVITPGDDARAVWEAIVGEDPRHAAPFIAKLMSAQYGRIAALYDAVAHLDAPHQRFALGAPGDPNRIDAARRLVDAVTHEGARWHLDEHPFIRGDVDASLLLRRVALDAEGVPAGPPARVLAEAFGERPTAAARLDAAWLAAMVLSQEGVNGRRRLETFCFGQRAFAAESGADPATLVSALRAFLRYPALMLTLETNGVRTAAVYAAAGRAAAALGRNDEAIALFQGGLTIVDRSRAAGTLRPDEARRLAGALIAAATHSSAAALIAWLKGDLLDSLRRSAPEEGRTADAESLVLQALAGPNPNRPVEVAWEGQRYAIDLARPALRRLTAIRKAQQETPLDEALASATPRNLSVLSASVSALVYAIAIGDPGSQAAAGGQVWRRHRFGIGAAPRESVAAWRLATEVFDSDGWHLTGSLLRLDVALASLALRRLDPTDMPASSSLSTMDRRNLAQTIALIEPGGIDDESRDVIAAALARGRTRVASLAAQPGELDTIAADAALSEWRLSAVRWLLAHDAARVPGAFSLLELFRLGRGTAGAGWGTSARALDGCFCLRMPDLAAWEDYAGRASTGVLGTQLPDVMLRTAEALAARRLPSVLIRDVMAFAMQDVMDQGRMAHFDDWQSLVFAARDLKDDRFDDYVAALTAGGPLVPLSKTVPR